MIYLEDLIVEPFHGFSSDALIFLKKLKYKRNNNKQWFDKNRYVYEMHLKEPMRILIQYLSFELKKIDEKIYISNKSVFRINRDIRFKKDKTPYKTHYGAAFTFDVIKRPEIPQFYFHISSDEFLFAAGQYSTVNTVMDKIKKKIYLRNEEFLDIINNEQFLNNFGSLKGEFYDKLPTKYDYSKNVQFLQKIFLMKNIYVFKSFPPDISMLPELAEEIINCVKLTYDFNKFLFYV